MARRVLIAIGGSIAAYKVCEVISQLFQAGVEVRVVLTEAAQAFITPVTVSTLSRHRAYTDQDFWQPTNPRPLHIELGEWAELIVIAPLTANTLGKLVYGLADNLLTNIILASGCPILVAPAMNTDMWEQYPVQQNWQQLSQNPRYHTLNPGSGLLACDRTGSGRLAEPEQIITGINCLLYRSDRDLRGKHLLISAGATREYLDPVRFISNPATGKMGIALATAAFFRGAQVSLVHGAISPHLLALLPPLHRIEAINANAMKAALLELLPQADWVIMSAAVGDVQPANYSPHKLPKNSLPSSLPLLPVPDIISSLASVKLPHQLLIGFAAQTGDFVNPAKEKMLKKGLDAIVANPVDVPNAGFGTDDNVAVFLDAQGREKAIPPGSKLNLAHQLWDWLGEIKSNK